MRPKPDSDDPDRAGVLRREDLITRLRREAAIRDSELADLRVRLDAAEHELEDLRAIRDALTPFDLPERPGLDLAAAFVAAAERVSGDFYLVAEGAARLDRPGGRRRCGARLGRRASRSLRAHRIRLDGPVLG
jgi:hypothetical protein